MKFENKIAGLLKIEIASVRANLLPMVILWGLAGTAVAAYYLLPGVAGSLEVFADWQIEYGMAASFANRFVCGGLVPGVFLLSMPSIRPKRAVVTVLAQAVWNGFSFRREGGGMTRDWFVRSYVSNIVMSWAITIPTLVCVYSFPMELQITVSGFIGAMQALLFIFIGRKT